MFEGEQGKQLMQINSQMNPENEGFNDLSAMKFDLEMDETVETSTLRRMVAEVLTDFSHNNPETIPPDIILEYADVPFTVKQRIKQTWEEKQKLQQQNLEADRALEERKIDVELEKAKINAGAKIEDAKIKAKQQRQGD